MTENNNQTLDLNLDLTLDNSLDNSLESISKIELCEKDKYVLSEKSSLQIGTIIYKDIFKFLLEETTNELYRDKTIENRIYEIYSNKHIPEIANQILLFVNKIKEYCDNEDLEYKLVNYDINNIESGDIIFEDEIDDYVSEILVVLDSMEILLPFITIDELGNIYNSRDVRTFESRYNDMIYKTILSNVFNHLEWSYNLELSTNEDESENEEEEYKDDKSGNDSRQMDLESRNEKTITKSDDTKSDDCVIS